MEPPTDRLRRTDVRMTRWMAKHGPGALRLALGVVFLWFGAIKFVPGLSPADELATMTIERLTFGLVTPGIARPALATLETLIGLGLITGVWLRVTIFLLVFQMLGTVTPLFLFPDLTWKQFPIALTLEGQYIVKNVVLVAAALVVGATVRGGKIIASPTVAGPAARADEAEAKAAKNGV